MARNSHLKLGVIVLMLAAAIAVLGGCSSKPEANESSATSAAADQTAKAADPSASAKSAGDNDSSASNEKVTLSVSMTVSDKKVQDAYYAIVEDFESQNPNIKVDLQFPGDYENVMKVKMSASDLPDVFDTHGWAIARYGQYLLDLRDQPWVGELEDSIRPVITDEAGKVHVLPISVAKDGLSYNVELLKQYNIEVPNTFDELIAAGEKIKAESNGEVIPFYFSAPDNWMVGQFFDYLASSLLVTPQNNQADQLLDGSFDWTGWTPLPAKFKEMNDKGLINEDVLSSKYDDLPKLFAQNKVAFAFLYPQFSDQVHQINPDVKIGMMPVPAWYDDDQPNFSGGERNTMGIWKDSEHIPQAKQLLSFFAEKQNLAIIANAFKLPSGLKGVEANHEFVEYYEKYQDVQVVPYFDRVYLPSGMWDVMCNAGVQLLANQITPEQYSEIMEQEVNRLTKK